MNKVLVLAVHPDDETLGCGGTLLKHKALGEEIYWLIITAMTTDDGFETSQIKRRNKEIRTITAMYDFDGVEQLGFPTRKLDQIPFQHLVEKISGSVQIIRPNIVYLPFKGDVHSDHRIAFEAAYSCMKNFRAPFIKKMLMMETVSETEFAPAVYASAFVPNYFVDISAYIERKIKIILKYSGETGKFPSPRSPENIKALAMFRGATAGCKFAESFMLLKEIS